MIEIRWLGYWLHLQEINWMIKITASFTLNSSRGENLSIVSLWVKSAGNKQHKKKKKSTLNVSTTLLRHQDIQLSDGLIFSQFLLPRQPHYKGVDKWGHRRHIAEVASSLVTTYSDSEKVAEFKHFSTINREHRAINIGDMGGKKITYMSLVCWVVSQNVNREVQWHNICYRYIGDRVPVLSEYCTQQDVGGNWSPLRPAALFFKLFTAT